jgi:hypothetical protein
MENNIAITLKMENKRLGNEFWRENEFVFVQFPLKWIEIPMFSPFTG